MSRIISRSESWEEVHRAFQNVKFTAFDYDSIKASLIENTKLYNSETFNDYIESSEYIAILELFSYVGELLMYRSDLNASENFMETAQRKESVLRLAKYISYKPSRNIPHRGLVKLDSITTTETILDDNQINLSNRRIEWNNINDSQWKQQWFAVMDRVLNQPFGSVTPNNRIEKNNVLFELYTLNNNRIENGVMPYRTNSSTATIPMELVPISLAESSIVERRPNNNAAFNVVYASDGLGDQSEMTGFFMYTKQGILQRRTESFDGLTPHHTINIDIPNVNDTDVWINGIDNSGDTTTEWINVDISNGQNIIFNTNQKREKYEIETKDEDKIRIIFGDGEFADIPSGDFDIWFRSSVNDDDLNINKTDISGVPLSFTYVGGDGTVHTLKFEFSLVNSLQNSSASEDIDHLKRISPNSYYTQDRMVNGKDYNVFPLQDISILKLRTINRTYAGESKYNNWYDASETYESVRMTGDDLALYYKSSTTSKTVVDVLTATSLLLNDIQPLLASTDFLHIMVQLGGLQPTEVRHAFTPIEISSITTVINAAFTSFNPVELFFDIPNRVWQTMSAGSTLYDNATPMITITFPTSSPVVVDVVWQTSRLVAESNTLRFWNVNDGGRVVSFEDLGSNSDTLEVIKANLDGNGTSILTQQYGFDIIGQLIIDEGVQIGLPSIHKLNVMPSDTTDDGVPDNINLSELLDIELPIVLGVNIPLPQPTRFDDIDTSNLITWVGYRDGVVVGGDTAYNADVIADTILVLNNIAPNTLTIQPFVYLSRNSLDDDFSIIPTTTENISGWILDSANLFERFRGRNMLNFAWNHRSSQNNLINPSSTNIHDMFVITKGYYNSVIDWLDGGTITPQPPTPVELRNDYNYLLPNAMISDDVILHSGKFKILFGVHAHPTLRAKFKIVRSSLSAISNNEIKTKVISAIRLFFDIGHMEFGETMFFTELSSAIHNALGGDIESVVIVPISSQHKFGDLFQVLAREDEIFQPSIGTNDIEIVEQLSPTVLGS